MRMVIAIWVGCSTLVACEGGNHTQLVQSAEVTAPDAGLPQCISGSCEVGEVCSDGRCLCAEGYLDTADGCVDQDECADDRDDCHPWAICTNTMGAFECVCSAGYEGDGRDCTDIDECTLGIAGCHPEALCTNIEGGATCACAPGFVGDGVDCQDVDECTTGTHRCDPNAQCENSEGSHTCTCGPGYAGDGQRCADIDECAAGTHDCDPNALCTNTLGSYQCQCAPGYRGDGQVCDDIDECMLATDNCSDFAHCTNVPGRFQCDCQPGYVGDGIRCENVDECAGDLPVCPAHALCQDIPGGFDCRCEPGYAPVDGQCVDLDECATGLDLCDADAMCVNTDGDYRCDCPVGLLAVDRRCVDLDECADQTDDCDATARCINTRGGFECACPAGYTGDGRQCDDVDECSSKTHDCHDDAVCRNTPGAFECECGEGYEGDGRQCDDIDECMREIAFCHPRAVCLNTAGAWDCECRIGYDGDGVFQCNDVNECGMETDECADVARCTNGIGTYDCECPDGFRGDGYECDDIDECADGTHDCPTDPLCINTAGGFECAPSVFFVCDCAEGEDNCRPGNDMADGRTPETAWRSLEPLAEPDRLDALEPGVSVRFCRGGRFLGDVILPGQLRCDADTPCAIGAYAPPESGADLPPPLIVGTVVIPAARRGLVVEGLSIVGMGMGDGVRIDPGAAAITLRELTIRNWSIGIRASSVTDFTLSDAVVTDNAQSGWLGGGERVALLDTLFARNGGDDFTHHNVHFDCAEGCTDINIRGNELTDSSLDEDGICFLPALGVFGLAQSVSIADNHIHQPLGTVSQGCDGIAVGPATRGEVEGFSEVIIRGNRVLNMGGAAIGVSACANCVVENNVVIQEQMLTFKGIVGPDRRVQLEDSELDAFVVRNNSIWIGRQIDTVAIAIQVYRQGRGHQIVNNAIVNLSQGFNSCCIDQDRDLTRYDDIDHNICLLADDNPRANWALGYSSLARWQDTGFGQHSLEADPGYLSPMGPDFDLRAQGPDAPIVDAGKIAGSPGTDLDGRARDQMPDVGAFEYAP